jgi:hypothetical protein
VLGAAETLAGVSERFAPFSSHFIFRKQDRTEPRPGLHDLASRYRP